jgi:cytochrome c biogenesis factor
MMATLPKQFAGVSRTAVRVNAYLTYGVWLLALTFILLLLGLFVPVVFNFTLSPVFFNTTLLPIWIVLAILMAIAPFKKFKMNTSITTALLAAALFLAFYAKLKIAYVFLGGSGAIVAGAMLPLIVAKPRLALTHMGIGLCLIGLACHSDSPVEATLILTPGQVQTHNAYDFELIDTIERVDPFVTHVESRISIQQHVITEQQATKQHHATGTVPQQMRTLTPARQFFHSSKLQRVKASFCLIDAYILMISNIETLSDGRAAITVHEKFGLLWLVLGCALAVFGVLVMPIRKFLRR